MLRLHKVEASRLDYYLAITAAESTSPFSERDGYWLGNDQMPDAERSVVRGQLVDVLLGRDPVTGRPRNPFQARVRYCAIDATFAAPKTVSVLHALGDREVRSAIEASQRQSVLEVMDFVGRKLIVVQRTKTVDAHPVSSRGSEPRKTERVSMRGSVGNQAVFEHRTSRSSDPHLHSHVLVPNVATADGLRWSAFDSRPIYIHSGLLGSLYRSSLRRHLTLSVGVQWREISPGWYDVVGLSPPMVKAFSQRSTAILAEMTRHGFASSKAAAITSARLRAQRDLRVSYDDLRAGWQQLAYRVGISPSRVQEMTGVRPFGGDDRERHRLEVDRALTRDSLLSQSIPGRRLTGQPITERYGAQTLAVALRSVADHLREGVTVAEAEAAIDLAVERGAMVTPTDLWPFGPRGAARSGPRRSRDEPIGWSGQDRDLSWDTSRQQTVRLLDDDVALSL